MVPAKQKGRWLVMLGICFTLVGCEAFAPHPIFVAQAGGHDLSVANVADLFVHGEALPVNRLVAEEMVRHWIDVVLVAQSAARGDSLGANELVTESMWPDIRAHQIFLFRELLYAENVHLDSVKVDSVFERGDVRFLAHILRGVRVEDGPEVRASQRATADAIHRALLNGAEWADANQENQDERARSANGALGMVTRGSTPPRFENAAFALAPGGLSEVVETRGGYHIIYRPRLEEVFNEFAFGVEGMLRAGFDSIYGEALMDDYGVSVEDDAPLKIRNVLQDPYRAFGDRDLLAHYDGGQFLVDDFVRWLQLLTPEITGQLLAASDDEIITATGRLILQELLWFKADSLGLVPADSVMNEIGRRYRAALSGVWEWANISPDSLAEVAPNPPDRERIAVIRVQEYLEGVAGRRFPGQTVPPFLAARLRANTFWVINQAGMQRALEQAVQRRIALAN